MTWGRRGGALEERGPGGGGEGFPCRAALGLNGQLKGNRRTKA